MVEGAIRNEELGTFSTSFKASKNVSAATCVMQLSPACSRLIAQSRETRVASPSVTRARRGAVDSLPVVLRPMLDCHSTRQFDVMTYIQPTLVSVSLTTCFVASHEVSPGTELDSRRVPALWDLWPTTPCTLPLQKQRRGNTAGSVRAV